MEDTYTAYKNLDKWCEEGEILLDEVAGLRAEYDSVAEEDAAMQAKVGRSHGWRCIACTARLLHACVLAECDSVVEQRTARCRQRWRGGGGLVDARCLCVA